MRPTFSIWQLVLLTAVIALITWRLYPDAPFDRRLAEDIPLVLRVQVNHQGNGSKYHWREVDVLRVIKNSPKIQISKSMNIASSNLGSGLPNGVCTVYLVPYNNATPEHGWKLYKDGETAGFTHHDAE